MSIPIRKEFTIHEKSFTEYLELYSVEFDDKTDNMMKWILLNILTKSNLDDPKRIYGRLLESITIKSEHFLNQNNQYQESFENIFNFLIERINLYPEVYTELYDEIVTKNFFWQQYMEFISSKISLDISQIDNPYENSLELVLTGTET